MQLLRTIIIIVVVYYLVRYIFRYLLPFLARYFIRKASENQYEQTSNRQKEGEMHIRYKPGTHDIPENLGEIVDYEEIEDNASDEDKKKK